MNSTAPAYRERLVAPIGWWLGAVGFAVAIGWIFFVATTRNIAIVAGVVAGVLAVLAVARYGSATIVASADGLRAGRAFLDRAHVGDVTVFSAADWSRALGPASNRHAYTLLRPYIRTGVRVEVDDPDDPTPCWLVATRSPGAVARALGRTG